LLGVTAGVGVLEAGAGEVVVAWVEVGVWAGGGGAEGGCCSEGGAVAREKEREDAGWRSGEAFWWLSSLDGEEGGSLQAAAATEKLNPAAGEAGSGAALAAMG
jgi:hypothetical protein